MGAPQVLGGYFPDLRDKRAETAAIIGHNRYSTNTWPSFKRVQPCAMLGHNGEINTIAKLRQEARMLNVPIHPDGSDSQDLNRTVESLVHRGGLSLVEALELVLPPIVNEVKQLPDELRPFYLYLRQAFGPFAQGPEIPGYTAAGPAEPVKVEDRVLGGFGWQRDDMKLVQQMAATGAEPIGSLGYDGPLACLSPERQNLADYFKESVAVVTNPAIDREREVEHFSCRAVFGSRPGIHGIPDEAGTTETAFPSLLVGHAGRAPLS